MKLCRYGEPGREKPGMVDATGAIRDLSGVVADITGATLDDATLAKLRALDPASLPKVDGTPRFGAPVAGSSKFIAIGLNYSDHAKESNMAIPAEPVVFSKAVSCIQGPNDVVVLPKGSVKGDWEVELAFVIGKRARSVSEADALDHVAGYMVCNDVSDKGKGFDTFGPIGPWLVTRDEVPDPQNLSMWLDVNGRRFQTGNTSTMIFSVRKLVAYTSFLFTLEPGDIVTTGTPPGVGMGVKPDPVFLRAGDVMRLGIDGLGEQTQKVTGG
jgi:2,4-didehydro-3-deoxy-L-rhamnonate hydrolase